MKRIQLLFLIIFSLIIFTLNIFIGDIYVISIYGILIFAFILQKVFFSYIYNKKFNLKHKLIIKKNNLTCDVSIPFYNEKYKIIVNCIESVLSQKNVILKKVIVIDDGSKTDANFKRLKIEYSNNNKVKILRTKKNHGKRYAIKDTLKFSKSKFIMLMDADSFLESNLTLNSLLRSFKKDVSCVTAVAQAANKDHNFFTKILNTRLKNAFYIERAAQSFFGSVLVASGMCSIYRSNIIKDNADEWVSQTMFGIPQTFGDDRRLTAFALRHGRTIINPQAICETIVPDNILNFLKQQVRWNKSFFRESFIFINEFGIISKPGFLSFLEIFFWCFYLTTFINLFFNPLIGVSTFIIIYIAYIFASGLFRNISIILRYPEIIFLYPLYSVLHIIFLTPVRLYSILTILNSKWGTR